MRRDFAVEVMRQNESHGWKVLDLQSLLFVYVLVFYKHQWSEPDKIVECDHFSVYRNVWPPCFIRVTTDKEHVQVWKPMTPALTIASDNSRQI